MFMCPMKEMVLEVLLHLSIHDPSGALQPDLVEGTFQPCGKGWNLLMIALYNLVKILHEYIECHYCAKNNRFCKIWATLVVGPIYWAISAAVHFNECTILFLTTDSG